MDGRPSGRREEPDRRVVVWQVDLDASREHLPFLAGLLSPDELERAKGFLLDLHRERFIAGRAALRLILGDTLAMRPDRIRIRYGPSGKPEVDPGAGNVRFNVSHSHGRALIAVAAGVDVGVDIERGPAPPEGEGLPAIVFSDQERRELAEATDWPAAFLRGWTRKEAVLKALGVGLSGPLAELTVSLGRDAVVLAVPAGGGSPTDWTLIDLSGAAAVAALAARVPGAHAELRRMALPFR